MEKTIRTDKQHMEKLERKIGKIRFAKKAGKIVYIAMFVVLAALCCIRVNLVCSIQF